MVIVEPWNAQRFGGTNPRNASGGDKCTNTRFEPDLRIRGTPLKKGLTVDPGRGNRS